jgi:hypothetical protein
MKYDGDRGRGGRRMAKNLFNSIHVYSLRWRRVGDKNPPNLNFSIARWRAGCHAMPVASGCL